MFSFFKDPAAQAFSSAIFGTLFTVLLMLFLLNKQTEVEENKQRSQVVFNEKVQLFKSIIDLLEKCSMDGKISKDELPIFEFIMIRLTMIASNDTIIAFKELNEKIFKHPMEDDDEKSLLIDVEIKNNILAFANRCRLELELGSVEDNITFNEKIQPQIGDVLNKIEKARTTDRSIYKEWNQFEEEQKNADPLKMKYMPFAKSVHDLIIQTLKEANLKYEINYGAGTFSFNVPKELAKSRSRRFARFGLLKRDKTGSYLDGLYKVNSEIPTAAYSYEEDKYQFNIYSLDDIEKNKNSIRKGVVQSYKYLTE